METKDLYMMAQLVFDNTPHVDTPSPQLTIGQCREKFLMMTIGQNLCLVADGISIGGDWAIQQMDPMQFSMTGMLWYLGLFDEEHPTNDPEDSEFPDGVVRYDCLNDYEKLWMDL